MASHPAEALAPSVDQPTLENALVQDVQLLVKVAAEQVFPQVRAAKLADAVATIKAAGAEKAKTDSEFYSCYADLDPDVKAWFDPFAVQSDVPTRALTAAERQAAHEAVVAYGVKRHRALDAGVDKALDVSALPDATPESVADAVEAVVRSKLGDEPDPFTDALKRVIVWTRVEDLVLAVLTVGWGPGGDARICTLLHRTQDMIDARRKYFYEGGDNIIEGMARPYLPPGSV